jgi:hypothetical protein
MIISPLPKALADLAVPFPSSARCQDAFKYRGNPRLSTNVHERNTAPLGMRILSPALQRAARNVRSLLLLRLLLDRTKDSIRGEFRGSVSILTIIMDQGSEPQNGKDIPSRW